MVYRTPKISHNAEWSPPWTELGSLEREAKQDFRGTGDLLQPGSAGTKPSDTGGFSFQLEVQDLIPKGLNVNKVTVLQEEYIWVENQSYI